MSIKHQPATPLPWDVVPNTEFVPAYLCGDTNRRHETEVGVFYGDTTRPNKNAVYAAHAANAYPRLIERLRRFAAMHRDGTDTQEIACSRGIASDMTILTSGDFAEANELLRELGEAHLPSEIRNMSIANKWPEAFKRGAADCRAHYERFYAGEIGERDFPQHPYTRPDESLPWSQRYETEWHAYNAGWFMALPDDEEDARRRPQVEQAQS